MESYYHQDCAQCYGILFLHDVSLLRTKRQRKKAPFGFFLHGLVWHLVLIFSSSQTWNPIMWQFSKGFLMIPKEGSTKSTPFVCKLSELHSHCKYDSSQMQSLFHSGWRTHIKNCRQSENFGENLPVDGTSLLRWSSCWGGAKCEGHQPVICWFSLSIIQPVLNNAFLSQAVMFTLLN